MARPLNLRVQIPMQTAVIRYNRIFSEFLANYDWIIMTFGLSLIIINYNRQ